MIICQTCWCNSYSGVILKQQRRVYTRDRRVRKSGSTSFKNAVIKCHISTRFSSVHIITYIFNISSIQHIITIFYYNFVKCLGWCLRQLLFNGRRSVAPGCTWRSNDNGRYQQFYYVVLSPTENANPNAKFTT